MGEELQSNEKFQEFLAEIAKVPEFPALSRSMEEVMLKVDTEASIQHITNVILKDYSLTLRILRASNSALHHRGGREIKSISQAVALLGVEAVREMATSVVLLEHFRKHSPGLRELILLSLLTANHAGEVAKRVGYPRKEEAYLCGMFRNLGEILVACYHPRAYAAVLLRMQEDRIPVSHACLDVLGFEYDKAGRAVAHNWHIPESVRECMSDRMIRLRRAPTTEAERLEAITHFAHKLTTAVYRREPSGARASVNLLLSSLGPVLNLTHNDVRQIVEHSLQETQEVFHAMSVPIDRLRLKRQTEAALEEVEEEQLAESGLTADAEPETLASLLRDVTANLDRDSVNDLRATTLMVMEAIYRGGPFDHVLFALLDANGYRLVGKLGFGESIDTMIPSFDFPVAGANGPVAAAVVKRTDVFVSGPRDRRYEGTRFAQIFTSPLFGIYPLVAGGNVLGCLYFDRREPKNFDAPAMAALSGLRDQLCRVFMRKQSGSILTTTGSSR